MKKAGLVSHVNTDKALFHRMLFKVDNSIIFKVSERVENGERSEAMGEINAAVIAALKAKTGA